MCKLRVDTHLLCEAGAQLRFIAGEFAHANANSDDAADAIGHDGFAEAARSFAHNWDDRRAEMVEKIGTLAESAKGVGEAFEKLDEEFAAGLRGQQ